jgi:hypothetical protein
MDVVGVVRSKADRLKNLFQLYSGDIRCSAELDATSGFIACKDLQFEYGPRDRAFNC